MVWRIVLEPGTIIRHHNFLMVDELSFILCIIQPSPATLMVAECHQFYLL